MVAQSVAERVTFKGNVGESRHGWLRLTPAYSVHLVGELLEALPRRAEAVLDPFCGTGTTALVCAERGIECATTDINPFLLWLGRAKTRPYGPEDLAAFRAAARTVAGACEAGADEPGWQPPLHQIDRWWERDALAALGRAMTALGRLAEHEPEAVVDLLKVAFCRTLIASANVSFGHQSLSFKRRSEQGPADGSVATAWERAAASTARSAGTAIGRPARFILCDARALSRQLEPARYDVVITSPPYPNRMSYIRELRPYMYWLGYLQNGREAGELDWQAIGGTWGCATSRVGKWQPPEARAIPYAGFGAILARIAERSPLLARYVHKYFYDMAGHCRELFGVLRPGGTIHYIVGNSKFYEVLLPVEQIYAALFAAAGFTDVDVRMLRRRTSKKELFEFDVTARKPA